MSDIGVNLSANDATPQFSVGQVLDLPDSGVQKSYKYVQYSSGAGTVAAVAGQACYVQKVATAGVTGMIVTSDISDSDGAGAGILQVAITDDYYGWIQVGGPATMSLGLVAGADGNALTAVGATDGKLDVSGAVTDSVCGYAIDASAFVIMCDFPR